MNLAFYLYGIFTGKVTGAATVIGGIWLICGFFVQLAIGIIELKEGSIVGGNTFTWFSAYFMLATEAVWVFEYFAAINGWKYDAHYRLHLVGYNPRIMAGISGLFGAYSTAALMNNTAFGRQIFPFPGPIVKKTETNKKSQAI